MNLAPFGPFLSIIEIVLAVALVVLVVIQSKGSDLGFIGGGDNSSGYRTKRGLEATMHKVTIALSIVFFIVTFLTFLALG